MIKIKDSFPSINKNKSINQLYNSIIKYNLEYVIVHGGNLRFEGIIYKKDLFEMNDARVVADLSEQYKKYSALIDDGGMDYIKEKSKVYFRKEKSLSVLPIVNKQGIVQYCVEKDILDKNVEENKFYYKYVILLQCGYSVGGWLRDKGIKSVNLIGAPELMTPLYNDLHQNQIIINYIIDHQHFEVGGIKSRNWGRLKGEELDKSDANIILYLNTQKLILDTIKSRNSKIKTMVVSNIVDMLFDQAAYYNRFLGVINNWIQNGVVFEYFKYPVATDVLNKNQTEKYMCEFEIIPTNYRKNFEKYKEMILRVVGYDDSEEDIQRYLIKRNISIINKGGTIELQDMRSKYFTIEGGKRVVTDQPDVYENTVYLIGPSWVFGVYEKDNDTMASCIQRLINNHNMQYRVINCGIPGVHWMKLIKNMSDIRVREGDVVILIDSDKGLENFLESHDVHVNKNQDFIQKPHLDYEIFADRDHLNVRGTSLLAESVFLKTFVDNNVQKEIKMSEIQRTSQNFLFQIDYVDEEQWRFQNELDDYVNSLPEVKKIKNGAIVMNCNPFTKGHRYLVESAAKQVDTLYIFIVEEDKSFFPYKDRLMLVREGTKDLNNVIVLSSGKFIISSLTFPEYFIKEDNKDVIIDASEDLRLFGERIAPKLNIAIRFAGAEPNDPVTAQYNKKMAKYLPDYGINFIEIPRVESNGLPVSASLVRKYLKEKKWDEILKLVPESTYEYLLEKYN